MKSPQNPKNTIDNCGENLENNPKIRIAPPTKIGLSFEPPASEFQFLGSNPHPPTRTQTK